MTAELVIRHLGQQAYEPVWHAMQAFTDARTDTTPDELWVLEHPPVFTQGQAGKAEHILAAGNIPIVQVDRGGQVTYHGPGQLVIYPLLDLTRARLGVRALVDLIEQAIVDVLADYKVTAAPRRDAPGVYVGEAKVASLGLRVRRGRSFHGLALNINMDLSPFQRINPCGYAGMAMCQLADFVPEVEFASVAQALVLRLAQGLPHQTLRHCQGFD